MGAIYHNRVVKSVRSRWPTLLDPALFRREDEALDRKARQLRGWATHLLATVIPWKVRRELLKGNHLITGRNGAGERVPIPVDELACLNIEIGLGSLGNPTTVFTDILIQAVKDEQRAVPTDEVKAHALISEVATLSSPRPGPKSDGKVPVATQAYDQMTALLSSQETSLPRGRKLPRGVRTRLIRSLAQQLRSDESTVRKAVQPLLDEWETE
jgi:hypothetical protein